MPLHIASKTEAPSGTAPGQIVTQGGATTLADSAAAAASSIALVDTMNPMSGIHPAVDAVNGPLTANTFITAGTPSLTGRTFYGWAAGVFRSQGMNWVSATTPLNTSGYSAAINASTPRLWNYGTGQGFPMESNHDFAFMSDTLSMTIFYFHQNGYSGSNYHDVRIFAEHEGRLKHIRNSSGKAMPMTSTAGGGLYYVTLTFDEARERQFRVMLPSNCYFIGALVDTAATIRKAPNVALVPYNGDSWGEPNGNVLAAPIGGAFPTGTYRTMGLCQEIAVATGWVIPLLAEGGTGEFNCNDSTSRPQSYTATYGESVFHGDTRINDAWTKFGPGSPLVLTVGGWNDGDLPGAPFDTVYQARVLAGIDKWIAKNPAIKLIYVSIQPVDQVGSGGSGVLSANRAASLVGQAAACAARPNNVIGYVDLRPMWPVMSMAGQRGNNVNSADTIHLHAKGADGVANWIVASLKPLRIPRSYYNAMLAAA